LNPSAKIPRMLLARKSTTESITGRPMVILIALSPSTLASKSKSTKVAETFCQLRLTTLWLIGLIDQSI